MFLDIVTISVSAGSGGDGCISTRREKFVPRGGPDGGNGGRGGSIYLQATTETSTLLDFRYRRRYRADGGRPGSGRRKTGADGADVTIEVPCGTSAVDTETLTLIGDLVDPGQRLLVAVGGKGGRGNWEFRSARDQTPMRATQGRPGQEREIRLELKLIADVGLVGAPNAGKSTLLASLTAARPRIADYPFTTLVPNLGIVDLGNYHSCTLADIPGLIEGASEGKGLGYEFLRHIERTRALLYLTDGATDDPAVALEQLRTELRDYGHRLVDLPFAVVVTKQDLFDEAAGTAALAAATDWCNAEGGRETMLISAATGHGLAEVRRLLLRLLATVAGPHDDAGTA